MFDKHFLDVPDACTLAQAIVDTVREPVLVLDLHLRVIAANRAFYSAFKAQPADTEGKLLHELGNGEWDIPGLRGLLEKIIPEHGSLEDFEVDHNFPEIGHRTMRLNARKVFYENKSRFDVLLGFEDVTIQRRLQDDKDELLKQKDILLDEIEHRVANSLQIIASIIMMKATSVDSEETRQHLQDAHNRVISVAAVQKHLHSAAILGSMEMKPYLETLCNALSRSMIADDSPVTLSVVGDGGISTCRNAESIGLIVTELVINSLKHAFNKETKSGQINVGFDVSGSDWKLSVIDNGIGKPDGVFAQPKSGLGTGIVKALAKQLDAQIDTQSGRDGTHVTITHATFGKKSA